MATSATTVKDVQLGIDFDAPLFARAKCTIPAPPDEGDDNASRPDIEWIPSYESFVRRVEQLKNSRGQKETTVPDGWPIHITCAAMALGIMAWGPGRLSIDRVLGGLPGIRRRAVVVA